MHRKIYVSELCRQFGLNYCGMDVAIDGLNLCNRKSEYAHVLTYVTDDSYVEIIKNNEAIAGIVIRQQEMIHYKHLSDGRQLFFIICEEPEKVFYDIHDYLYYETDFYDKFQFQTTIGENCVIHPSAVIEDGVIIGNNVVIGANSVVRRGTVIKDRCTIGCNSTIGSEGFQILRIENENRKIIHSGGVLIGENASIGDNSTICNALFEGYSYIGRNAMIDNVVYVGHNGFIGDNAVITSGTMLCGSAIVERGAWIGVNSSVLNRVTVGSYAKIGMGSVVTRDVPPNSLAYGIPAKIK